ncbi:MAG: dTMP kinase [Christensenellaceae bacterium]|nr:dTMP kinase [Christensenellaceae bacterium]
MFDNKQNMFIVIDGPDGTGKTTISRLLVEMFIKQNKNAVLTAEPTSSPLGVQIRLALKTQTNPQILLDMFLQDRSQHCKDFILPALNQGKIVVCDRYKLSTACYQQSDSHTAKQLLAMQKHLMDPDYTFILYFKNIKTIQNRMSNRKRSLDVFENVHFQQKINDDFIRLAKELQSQNVFLISAEQNTKQILKQIMEVINV